MICFSGEDGLTLQALTQVVQQKGHLWKGLLSILHKHKLDLGKNDEVRAFYRPSFGRGAPPCFGEFDAIVFLKSGVVFLIEAKADFSKECKGKKDWSLRPEQTKRHKIFRHILGIPKRGKLQNSEAYTFPKQGTTLRNQIIEIRKALPQVKDDQIFDVLLYFYSKGSGDSRQYNRGIFHPVNVPYKRTSSQGPFGQAGMELR